MGLFPLPILTSTGDSIVTADGFAVSVEGTSPPFSSAMRQYIVGKTYGNSIGSQSTYPVYTPLRGNGWSNDDPTFHFRYSHPWSAAGVFKNLYVEIVHPVENPVGNGWPAIDFAVYINDVATALTVTVPAMAGQPIPPPGYSASAQNTTTSVRIAPGDRVNIGRGPGTILPGFNQFTVMIAWSLTFQADNAGESSYGLSSWSQGTLGSTNLLVASPLVDPGGLGVLTESITEPTSHSIVPLEGAVFRLDVALQTAPGAGATRTLAMMLNGVVQDGSGGTVDTRVPISDSATTGFALFTLPIHVLDRLTVCQLVASGTAPAFSVVTASIAIRATNNGQFALAFQTAAANPTNDGTTDLAGGSDGGWAWTTARAPTPWSTSKPLRFPMSEDSMSLPGPIDPFNLQGLCMNLSATPGTGKQYAFTTRRAFADTPGTVTLSDSDVIKVGSGVAGLFSATTDRLDLQSVASGTPNASQTAWTWLVVAAGVSPVPTKSYPIRRLRRFMPRYNENLYQFISRFELILQAGVGLSTGQGSDPVVMFRLSRDGGQTWDDELQMSMGKQGEYERRAFLNRLGRARNPVIEISSSDPVFVSWIMATMDVQDGTS